MKSIALLIILLSINVIATPIDWQSQSKEINIGKAIEIMKDKDGELSFNEASSPAFWSKYKKSNSEIINFGFTETIYWLKFELKNNTNKDLVLEIATAGPSVCELYYYNDSGKVTHSKIGYHTPVDERDIKHHFQVYSLPKGEREYYLRVLSNTHPLPIKILEKSEHSINSYHQKISYGIYLGMMLFVIITNLFFFFSLRDRMYLFYALVVILYSCYALFVLDGFIIYLIPKVDLMFWYVFIPTVGVAVQTTYCVFFIDAKKYIPKTYGIVKYIIIYFYAYIFIRFALPTSTALLVNTIHAMISFFLMGYLGLLVGRKGNRLGYYFALAYLIYFILVVTEAIYIQTGSPKYIFGLSHVALATLMEALILSFLLSKRTEWENNRREREKITAQQQLMDSLRENERIVKKQNEILEQEVSKRTENLKSVNYELKEVVATKDKFFSIIAHDLRSPFNSLLGLSEILIGDYDNHSEEDKIKYIRTLKDGLHNSHNLLENLLIWSNSERNNISFSPENLNLLDLITESLCSIQDLHIQKHIEITNQVNSELIVNADKNMVSTILRNLISNAIKFTHIGGSIEISNNQDQSNGFVTINVSDNGIGISEEIMRELFTLSSNVTSPGTEQEKGSGLGLLICKEFVERHKGTITASSEIGKGSTFSFELPLARQK
ncbi:sensor histidine kinase [Labilibacter marinus]|uniref:sensor histidine kinase n=1 Tax=Labilibacter marinus TaxID=1477105 RepID=UPI00082C49A5|nr:sensor histidine kinase [Labilibacter marinus]